MRLLVLAVQISKPAVTADFPKSAGREAALEVGLEICAAAVRRCNSVYNLSLSSVAACHRWISAARRDTTDVYW